MWWNWTNTATSCIQCIEEDLDMPNNTFPYKTECTCNDPLRPNEKLYECGSQLCHQLKVFYQQYLKDEREDNPDTEGH